VRQLAAAGLLVLLAGSAAAQQQGQGQSQGQEMGAMLGELNLIQRQLAEVSQALRARGEAIAELRKEVGELGQQLAAQRGEAAPSLAAPFLAAPPASSDALGVAKAPVFSPRLEIDSQRRHDILSVKLLRVTARGTVSVGELEFGNDSASVPLPIDRNGELYVVEWSTSEGHTYALTLRDGLSGQPAATVPVKPRDTQGRLVFVGYRLE
jgi:hypothetical protein